MKIFIDTADVYEIRQAQALGMVDGVTTNPSHIANTGRKFMEVVKEICSIVDRPISAECVSMDSEGMIREARELAKIHKNINVKIPICLEALAAIKTLSAEGIRVNTTLIFQPMQALLAAKAGAAYVSPFVGRLDDVSHEGMNIVRQIRTIFDNYGYKAEIIVASVRRPTHVVEAALAGADIVTMSLSILKQLCEHPLTDTGIKMFLDDWAKVPK